MAQSLKKNIRKKSSKSPRQKDENIIPIRSKKRVRPHEADSNLRLYKEIPAGYYHDVMLNGPAIQRTWHREKFLKVVKQIIPEWDVLDIGCGPGSLLSLLPERSGRSVGLDVAEKQIEFAKKTHTNKNLEFYTGGFPELPFEDNSFDCVLLVEVIEHLPKYELAGYFREVKRVLRKNGKIILTTPNYLSPWPVVEFGLNFVSSVNYEEQHITKFNIGRMKNFLEYMGFVNYHISTFFFIAPFLAFINEKFAKQFLKLENSLLPRIGQLMLVEIYL